MKTKFSKTWNKSVQPRKQRKYRANAPLHLKCKFLNSHLSQELIKKYGKRSLRVRVGDKVKVSRGKHKGREEKVERINVKRIKVYIAKVEFTKKDGSKTTAPINPSNLIITELNTEDKKRMQKLELKQEK